MAELNKEFPEQAKDAELSEEALDSVAGGGGLRSEQLPQICPLSGEESKQGN